MSKRPASQELDHDPMMARKFSHLKITSEEDFAPAQDFALSILENRKLAHYVRRVTLNYAVHWGPFPAQALSCTATTEKELEKQAIFKAAIAEQKWEEADATELLKRLMTTSSQGFNQPRSDQLFPDAVVALLLPILPNFQRWTVGDIDRPPYVGKAIQRAKDGIFGSISVNHIELFANTMYNDALWGDYSFPAFQIFRNLPFLKSITGKGIGGTGIEDGGRYYDIPRKATVVREIDLKDCELSGECLSKIIDFSTPGLEAFTYRFGGRLGDRGIPVIYSPQLAKALTPHGSTMRSLDIDIDNQIGQSMREEMQDWKSALKYDEDTKIEDEEKGDSDTETLDSADSKTSAEKWEHAMESDPYFSNLTHLRIGIKLASRFAELSGKKTLAEWLPTGLRELEIVGYRPQESSTITKQVTEVVQQQELILPNLKVLKGIEEYIENGEELHNEYEYVTSDESSDESGEESAPEDRG